jgi:hypothetical protein
LALKGCFLVLKIAPEGVLRTFSVFEKPSGDVIPLLLAGKFV